MELQLDPSNVKNRSEVKSSLTDLYEISVFSSQFKKQSNELEEQELLKQEELYKQIFSDVLILQKNSKEELKNILFQKNSELVLTEDYSKTNYKVSVFEILIISIPAILLLYFYAYQEGKKRRRKKKNDNLNVEI